MPSFSAEQVEALAPDAASLGAGRGLSGRRRWSDLGRSGRGLWGLCQGSGAKPYQTQVDVLGPAFRCSCPSRKSPCKHAIGLMLLAARAPDAIPDLAPPAWVAEWLAGREAREARAAAAPDDARSAPDPEARARRIARREERVAEGLAEHERWLHDFVRQGLAAVRGRGYAFWDEAAARLVDAQAGGVANRVRSMAALAVAGREGWAEGVLEEAGLLQLLVTAHRRLDELPEGLRADVRTLVGWTTPAEEVLAGPRVRDRWMVLGRVVEEDERLTVQRVWLQGERSGRPALVLTFTHGFAPLDESMLPGTVVEADLAFFPGADPLRALVAERFGLPERLTALPGVGVEAAFQRRAGMLGHVPWLTRVPMCLAGVVPAPARDEWLAAEPGGHAVRLACEPALGWRLAALSGGGPIEIFGEWRRERLRPLSAAAEGRMVPL